MSKSNFVLQLFSSFKLSKKDCPNRFFLEEISLTGFNWLSNIYQLFFFLINAATIVIKPQQALILKYKLKWSLS